MTATDSAPPGTEPLQARVLESLNSGVMLIGASGRVETINAAGAKILGIDAATIVGRAFAEITITHEHLDALTDVVLAPAYEGGGTSQQIVQIRTGERQIVLSVATSYLQDASAAAPTKQGVVALFSDITEIEALRAREIALARDVEAKHHELGKAYGTLETRNRELAALLRKIRTVRTGTTVAAIVLIVAITLWAATDAPSQWLTDVGEDTQQSQTPRQWVSVTEEAISATITVPSRVEPRRDVTVTSPRKGRIARVHVEPGQTVHAGDRLIELDTAEALIRKRQAQAQHLRAERDVTRLRRWAESVEASKAKRTLARARIAAEASANELEQTRFLFERGLLPGTRLAAAERVHHNRQLDLDNAEQDLQAVLAHGEEQRAIAQIELENARAVLEHAETTIVEATLHAPISGVVRHTVGGKRSKAAALRPGNPVEAGAALLSIADSAGIRATGRVDEANVRRIREGHTVRITGQGFAGLVLEGKVDTVATEATTAGRSRVPTFEIIAIVEHLDPNARASVRLGMSAHMEIVVYEQANALTVPIEAIRLEGRKPALEVRDAQSGETRLVEVTTGVTTRERVEIRSGVQAGTEVALR